MSQTAILFENARIIDGLGHELDRGWLLVRGERIEAFGGGKAPQDQSGPPAAEVIDLSGRTLMPGLIDAHVHLALDGSPDPMTKLAADSLPLTALRAADQARRTLASGITTVRDLGCRDYLDISLKQAIEQGLTAGPRMICAGRMITITGGHGWQAGYQADGPAEVVKGVRMQIKAGVDVVKFMATGGVLTRGGRPGMPQLTEAEMTAGIAEAHKVGLKTAAHSQGLEGAKSAVAAGIDSVEHAVDLDGELIDQMAQKGVFAVPTLSAPFNILAAGRAAGIPEEYIEKTERLAKIHVAGLTRARLAGVKIAMGTDAGTPFNYHGRNGGEVALLTKLGFSALEAISCATSAAAELLGLAEELGSISPGKLADLIIVNGNPLADLALLAEPRNITAVYKGGLKVNPS